MSSLRKWATPLTVGSFMIMGVTGSLMFFHVDIGLNKTVHEWAGWAMLIGVGAHMLLNWRAFTTYFKRPLAVGIMAVGAVALALSFVPMGGEGGNPAFRVVNAMNSATVESVVALSGQPMAEAIAHLGEAGFDATPQTIVGDLTGNDRGKQMQLIKVLFP